MSKYVWQYSYKEYFQKWLKVEYPECSDCPYLEVENYKTKKCRCFYRIKDKCILK